jgi:hypothetical protein
MYVPEAHGLVYASHCSTKCKALKLCKGIRAKAMGVISNGRKPKGRLSRVLNCKVPT